MIMNKRMAGNNYLVCVCDEDLLGKILKENGLKIKVSKGFYGNLKASEEEVINELSKATIINVLGKESINTLRKVKKIINVTEIQGVPHAQWVKIL